MAHRLTTHLNYGLDCSRLTMKFYENSLSTQYYIYKDHSNSQLIRSTHQMHWKTGSKWIRDEDERTDVSAVLGVL